MSQTLINIGGVLLVFGAVVLFVILWLRSAAYVIKGGAGLSAVEQMKCPLVYPNGKPVPFYDGNDPKHFPKWEPYVSAP